nr:hypothetical protein [Tanacetum cinerariifolium]
MLRDAVRPTVQVIGFQLLNHRPLSEDGQLLLQGIIREVIEVGLLQGPPKLRTAIIEAAVKYFGYMDDALAPKLHASSRNVFNVFWSNPFLDATVNSILPLARSKQERHKMMRSEVMEQYKIMMNYYNVEWRWDLSLTLSPITGVTMLWENAMRVG